MTLIKSISGIRGTIGGPADQGLTPIDAVKFASAYGTWLSRRNEGKRLKVVIGRDARISGPMISDLVRSTLVGLGIDIIDLGLSTTPTVEVAVPMEKANGGIILTASHNPKQWNALKLLNEKGEFISGADGEEVLRIAEAEDFNFGEEQSSNVQILKGIQNVDNGYYMIIAVHENVTDRDEFLEKVVSAGQSNINFLTEIPGGPMKLLLILLVVVQVDMEERVAEVVQAPMAKLALMVAVAVAVVVRMDTMLVQMEAV